MLGFSKSNLSSRSVKTEIWKIWLKLHFKSAPNVVWIRFEIRFHVFFLLSRLSKTHFGSNPGMQKTKKKDFCLQSKRSLICIEKRCVWKEWHRLYLNMTATVLHQSLFWSLSHVMWGYLQEWQMNSTTKLTHGKYQLVTTSFI